MWRAWVCFCSGQRSNLMNPKFKKDLWVLLWQNVETSLVSREKNNYDLVLIRFSNDPFRCKYMWSSISCNDNQRPLPYLLNKAGESERWPTRENTFPRRNPRLWRPTQEGGWGGCKLCLEHTLPLSQHIFLGCISITALDWNNQTHHEPNKNPFMQKLKSSLRYPRVSWFSIASRPFG